MTNPVGKPPLHPQTAKKDETPKERVTRVRANSKTLTPEQIKAMMEIQKKDKK